MSESCLWRLLCDLQWPGRLVPSAWQGGVQHCPSGNPLNCCWLLDPLRDPCSFLRFLLLHCWSGRGKSPQWTPVTSSPACRSSSLHCSGCTAAALSTSKSFCSEERSGVKPAVYFLSELITAKLMIPGLQMGGKNSCIPVTSCAYTMNDCRKKAWMENSEEGMFLWSGIRAQLSNRVTHMLPLV